MSKEPEGYELSDSIDKSVFLSEGYQQWTWGDLKEMAVEFGCTDATPVWIMDGDGKVRPIEVTSGDSKGLYL